MKQCLKRIKQQWKTYENIFKAQKFAKLNEENRENQWRIIQANQRRKHVKIIEGTGEINKTKSTFEINEEIYAILNQRKYVHMKGEINIKLILDPRCIFLPVPGEGEQ